MPEAIVMTREYDGTYTVGVDGSLVLSALSRSTAHQFVATYRRLAAASVEARPAIGEKPNTTGGRSGQPVDRSLSPPRRAIRIHRRQEQQSCQGRRLHADRDAASP